MIVLVHSFVRIYYFDCVDLDCVENNNELISIHLISAAVVNARLYDVRFRVSYLRTD